MRALLQRVKQASVSVAGTTRGSIAAGLLVLLGVAREDTEKDAEYLARRCASLRIFDDDNEKMNLSVKDISGNALVVSQFTLLADTRKGNRPSFTDAAPPETAERLYEKFVSSLRGEIGSENVKTGVFRAMMDVHLINTGPVTVLVESKETV